MRVRIERNVAAKLVRERGQSVDPQLRTKRTLQRNAADACSSEPGEIAKRSAADAGSTGDVGHGGAAHIASGPRKWHLEPVSTATTEGIKVTVRAVYVPEQSSPRTHRYVFAYTVRIANEGEMPAQLRSRHWIITDGEGRIEEVKGPGVVGQQPYLNPGDQFEYTSGCVLNTPRGEMRGTYQMHRPDGRAFEATIAPFSLTLPYSLN